MNNLIIRLQDELWKYQRYPLSQAELEVWHKTCCEAADKIERLETLLDIATELAGHVMPLALGQPFDKDVLLLLMNKYHEASRSL